MNRWVCELGGYEILLNGLDTPETTRATTVQEMQQWYLRYGAKGHPHIAAGPGIAEQLHRYLEQIRLGVVWWGSPHRWTTVWPESWTTRLLLEDEMRALTGFSHIFTEPAKYMMRPRRRRRP